MHDYSTSFALAADNVAIRCHIAIHIHQSFRFQAFISGAPAVKPFYTPRARLFIKKTILTSAIPRVISLRRLQPRRGRDVDGQQRVGVVAVVVGLRFGHDDPVGEKRAFASQRQPLLGQQQLQVSHASRRPAAGP